MKKLITVISLSSFLLLGCGDQDVESAEEESQEIILELESELEIATERNEYLEEQLSDSREQLVKMENIIEELEQEILAANEEPEESHEEEDDEPEEIEEENEVVVEEANDSTEDNTEVSEVDVPREHRNALNSAYDYLNYTSFSKQGLYEQLLFEDYPEASAQYAIDNIESDWNENALQNAIDYLDYTSFSDQGLYDQLIFEGYTAGQAQYAIDNLP